MYEKLRKDPKIMMLIDKGNRNLEELGYTDHSITHCTIVAQHAATILRLLGYDDHMQELARIAGILHDIGNAINRNHHAESGAILAYCILSKYGMNDEDIIPIVSAIGNHDESNGGAKDQLSAALIIADKCDVRRNRVRNKDKTTFDIHDRVNYAVTNSNLKIDPIKHSIILNLTIDNSICSMYDYFEIFLGRMMMCRKACEMLNTNFTLTVNGTNIL